MPDIHPTAVVDPAARLQPSVRIGPYCVIGADVEIGDDTVLHSHVVVEGRTAIGARCEVFPFASIGHRPQDLKYAGEPSELLIGDDNVIREHVTINPGTSGGGMVTRVGSGCLFMMGAHVAHDCQIGDRVIMANNATLGGHVVVGDEAIIGGLAAVHQFVRLGRNCMVGGMSGVENDVLPYSLVKGERANLAGLNVVGLRRRGADLKEVQKLEEAYNAIFAQNGTLTDRVDELADAVGTDSRVKDVIDFIRSGSARALCRPKQ